MMAGAAGCWPAAKSGAIVSGMGGSGPPDQAA